MIARCYLDALRIVCDRLSDCSVNWAITGSLGLALQGVPVEIHDIDLLTDEAGAYAIEQRLAEFVTREVSHRVDQKIRSHFGVLTINGVRVEIIGDAETRRSDGKWQEPWDLTQNTRLVNVHGLQVPALSLACEYKAYRRLGRKEKAELLREWLDREHQPRQT